MRFDVLTATGHKVKAFNTLATAKIFVRVYEFLDFDIILNSSEPAAPPFHRRPVPSL